MRRLIWMTVGLSALATAILGAWAARSGLRPLRRMSAIAASVSADSLNSRLPEKQMPAELAELAAAFNAMLARLDDSFQRLSAFSADIAHELRTPLSNLLTHTQVTLTRPGTLKNTARPCTATSKSCSGWRNWSTTCCIWPRPITAC